MIVFRATDFVKYVLVEYLKHLDIAIIDSDLLPCGLPFRFVLFITHIVLN